MGYVVIYLVLLRIGTAVMYVIYGAFCGWGFLTWSKVRRDLATAVPDSRESVPQ